MEARWIGRAEIFGVRGKMDLWSCGNCYSLFNVPPTQDKIGVRCPSCKRKIQLNKMEDKMPEEDTREEDSEDENPEEDIDLD